MIRISSLAIFSLFLSLPAVLTGNWVTEPLIVHEWGVQVFDWSDSKKREVDQQLPDFIHTDSKPGRVAIPPKRKSRDSGADRGGRNKPLLYFYRTGNKGYSSDVDIDVEMRFEYGAPTAWWPQVTNYRKPDETGKGDAIRKWDKAMKEKSAATRKMRENSWMGYQMPPDNSRSAILRLDEDEKRPDDDRMQLVWNGLSLSDTLPKNNGYFRRDLPDDHWISVARQVDADFVSNGEEVERFLFYEAATRETPAIDISPLVIDTFFSPERVKRNEFIVWNKSLHPIFDVWAIYRDSKKGVLWVGFVPMLPIYGSDQKVVLRIPDFDLPQTQDELKISPELFERRTKERLLENITEGEVIGGIRHGQAPSIPQSKTQHHALYEKEAVGLEKIWHDELFEAEGLTVVYRESPAYLDEAMPLSIFPAMYWEVVLSRCGLVINKNISLDKVVKEYQDKMRMSVEF